MPRSRIRRLRALLDRRIEEELEVRVGQDDGADVAPGHHDAARAREVALPGQEREAQLGDRGVRGHRDVDRGPAHVARAIDTVDRHVGEATAAVIEQVDLADERDQPAHVLDARRSGGGPAT